MLEIFENAITANEPNKFDHRQLDANNNRKYVVDFKQSVMSSSIVSLSPRVECMLGV